MGMVLFVVRFFFIAMNLASLVSSIQALGTFLILQGVHLKHDELLNQYELNYLGMVLMYYGILILILSVLAIVGSIFKIRILLIIVSYTQCFPLMCCVAISFIIFSIQGILSAQGLIKALGTQEECARSHYLEEANEAVITADKLLCSRDCECRGDIELRRRIGGRWTFGQARNIKNCDLCKTQTGLIKVLCEEVPGAASFVDQYFTSAQKRYFDFIKWLEQNFDCAGVCVPAEKFLFTDVLNGIPVGSCRGELRKWVHSNIFKNSVYGVIAGIFLLINLLLLSFLLFCPKDFKTYVEFVAKDPKTQKVNEQNSV